MSGNDGRIDGSARDGRSHRLKRVRRLGAIRAAGLRHVGAAAAALAAECLGGTAHEIDGAEAADKIVGDSDHDARLVVFAGADEDHDAGAERRLAGISQRLQILRRDAGNRLAEETYARERAEEQAQRQRMIAQGKSVEDQEILAARQRAEAAEAEVARLRAEEEAALKKSKQLEEYKAREAAAVAEAERIRTGK